MPTAFVYRRALRRFATSIVFTILNLVVCTLMLYWAAESRLTPLLLLLIVPLVLTLGNMWRCTVADLGYIGTALSVANAQTAGRVRAQV
ncbi:MAG TPA: hypothetical protein VJT08_09225 [Terriglobales bacterium]|nr:hypothetical protein [Acidobacteriaceae bacterium]HKR30648.1 hypothetical protein [Terriglobales bacterium]